MREQFFRRHDLLRLPAVHRADVHVLDEPHDDARAAEALDEIEHRVIVLATLDDGVDLDGEAGGARSFDAVQHDAELAATAVHLSEDLLVEAVEAHGDALQPGLLERRRVLGETRAVGRDRQVVGAVQLREPRDDLDDVAPQQRLAARQPQLLDAELEEHAGDALDLARRQPMRSRQELVVLAE